MINLEQLSEGIADNIAELHNILIVFNIKSKLAKQLKTIKNNLEQLNDMLYTAFEEQPDMYVRDAYEQKFKQMMENEIIPKLTPEELTYIRIKYGIEL